MDLMSGADDEAEYMYESSDEDEPLEYESDVEMLDDVSDTAEFNDAQQSNTIETDEDKLWNHAFWHRVLVEDEEVWKSFHHANESLPAWYRVPPPGVITAVNEEIDKPRD